MNVRRTGGAAEIDEPDKIAGVAKTGVGAEWKLEGHPFPDPGGGSSPCLQFSSEESWPERILWQGYGATTKTARHSAFG